MSDISLRHLPSPRVVSPRPGTAGDVRDRLGLELVAPLPSRCSPISDCRNMDIAGIISAVRAVDDKRNNISGTALARSHAAHMRAKKLAIKTKQPVSKFVQDLWGHVGRGGCQLVVAPPPPSRCRCASMSIVYSGCASFWRLLLQT